MTYCYVKRALFLSTRSKFLRWITFDKINRLKQYNRDDSAAFSLNLPMGPKSPLEPFSPAGPTCPRKEQWFVSDSTKSYSFKTHLPGIPSETERNKKKQFYNQFEFLIQMYTLKMKRKTYQFQEALDRLFLLFSEKIYSYFIEMLRNHKPNVVWWMLK